MTTSKEKYQQQILFEEVELSKSNKDLPSVTEQVILDNEHWQQDITPELRNDEIVKPNKPKWRWRIALLLFFTLVLVEVVEFFTLGFRQSPIIASLYASLLLLLSSIAGVSLAREYRSLVNFKRRQKFKQTITTTDKKGDCGEAIVLCQNIVEQLPCDVSEQLDNAWQTNASNELSNAEVLSLFSKQVLTPIDKKVIDKISRYSTEAVVLVTLSPIAVVDMLLMFWRNLKMIDEIAYLYGLRLGYWSRIKLIKQVFVNMVYAGASELIADVGADLLGADLLGKLSARLAQGLGAGMLTARLGIKTMHLCRPLPFQQQGPKLKDIRKRLVGEIKALISQQVS
jgi:putative membrane protein